MSSFIKTIFEIFALFFYGMYSYLRLFYRKIIPRSKKSLDGEVFLITGSSSGIGREVAIHLAKNHIKTKLVLWDCNEVGNEETAETVRFFGAQVFCYKLDVSNQLEVAETAKQVSQDVGDVTILFNNAGVAGIADLFNQSPATIEKTIKVNLLSHFWTLKAFLPSMILRNHGHVVTTCSSAGWVGVRYDGPYSATKFAIRGYLESLRSELRHHPLKPTDLKFTTVYPAMVHTPLVARAQIKYRFPSLMEYMEPRYVAEKIVEAICRNQEELFLPLNFECTARLKSIMPQSLFDRIEDFVILQAGYTEDQTD